MNKERKYLNYYVLCLVILIGEQSQYVIGTDSDSELNSTNTPRYSTENGSVVTFGYEGSELVTPEYKGKSHGSMM